MRLSATFGLLRLRRNALPVARRKRTRDGRTESAIRCKLSYVVVEQWTFGLLLLLLLLPSQLSPLIDRTVRGVRGRERASEHTERNGRDQSQIDTERDGGKRYKATRPTRTWANRQTSYSNRCTGGTMRPISSTRH